MTVTTTLLYPSIISNIFVVGSIIVAIIIVTVTVTITIAIYYLLLPSIITIAVAFTVTLAVAVTVPLSLPVPVLVDRHNVISSFGFSGFWCSAHVIFAAQGKALQAAACFPVPRVELRRLQLF